MKDKRILVKGTDLGIRIIKAIHFIIVVALFTLCRCTFFCHEMGTSILRQQAASIILFTIADFVLVRVFNAYLVGQLEIKEIIIAQQLALFLSLSLVGIFELLERGASARLIAFLTVDFAVTFAWNLIWSIVTDRLYRKYIPRKTAVFVCTDSTGLDRLKTAFSNARCFQIEKTIAADSSSSIEEITNALLPYHAILTTGLPHQLQNAMIEYCACMGKECFLLPCVGDIILAGAMPMQSFNVLNYRASLPAGKPEYLLIKRVFDILISVCMLTILSPIMFLCALIIHISDGGPVLYRQRRLTIRGRVFCLYKFRSMRTDAEADGVARLSVENDERITRVGRWLRSTRFDELPQLFNVIKGDMSIVGPRPERPEIAERYQKEIPNFKLRLNVKAGLTGYAQVYGKYSTDPYSKLCMDLFYICHQSPILDLKLICCTLGIPFFRERANGIEQRQEKPHV